MPHDAPEPSAPIEAFRRFIAAATPIILGDIQARLPALEERLRALLAWMPEDNLLDVASVYLENSITELVAWTLHPASHPSSGLQRQRAWLESLGIATAELTGPAHPRTQLITGDGIPDMVLEFPSLLVVVEAKTGTHEDLAPSKRFQTVAYPSAVRRTLGLDEDFPTTMVFLTPGREDPKNPEAVATRYLDLVAAVTTSIQPEDMPAEKRYSFGMVYRHLLSRLSPAGRDLHAVVMEFLDWLRAVDWRNRPQSIARNLETVNLLEDYFGGDLSLEREQEGNSFQ